MARKYDRKIVLEDGTEYYGYGFGAYCDRVCELVFNTAVVGYQEIVSDLTYLNQAVVMTYPLIGNYGVTDEDYETKNPSMGALIVRDYNDMPSNFRYTKTLSELLEENSIPGLYGIDTRKLTRVIRNEGTKRVMICDASKNTEEAVKIINNTPEPKDMLEKVSCKKNWYSRTSNHKFNVVAIDCGINLSIIKNLNKKGCNVTVVPYNITAEALDFMKPDAIVISNGPGNPENAECVIELVHQLKGKYPMFGISLGEQIIALAYGAKTIKMKFGHRGANHPVRNLENNKIEIVSQNHGYVVDERSLKGTDLTVTHKNVLDGTVEGIECKADKMFAVQFTPDAGEIEYLYNKLITVMKGEKTNA